MVVLGIFCSLFDFFKYDPIRTSGSIISYAVDNAGIFIDQKAYQDLRNQLKASCPLGRLAETEDVANVVEFFASDLSSFVNGQHLLVNGGASM